ncbi:hypothetical protein [Streptomyces sp. NPDC058255]|uniref:hypothetical protein n=1 Tax=Streptomyces sp. NPDC058255 TaxID=3346407 RepID=UPI0036E2FF61
MTALEARDVTTVPAEAEGGVLSRPWRLGDDAAAGALIRPRRWATCDQAAAYGLVIDVAAGEESGIGVIAGRLRAL